MKTSIWQTGKKLGLAAAVCAFLAAGGCAHRELTAPCSDYKAARFPPAAIYGPGMIPCDHPLPMVRPPWTAAAEPPARVLGGEGVTARDERRTVRLSTDVTEKLTAREKELMAVPEGISPAVAAALAARARR